MKNYILSAFADEISDKLEEQLAQLNAFNISHIEMRGVDGKNVSALTASEAAAVKEKLDRYGIKVSAVGSPVGKIGIKDDFVPHFEMFKRVLETAKILGTQRIRIFSFFIPKGEDKGIYRDEVMRRLSIMLEESDKQGLILCHENEKDIYGEDAEGCLDIMKTFGGRIRCVFDPANFIVCGVEPYPYAYDMLAPYIDYMHIKDAKSDGIYPAGMGDGRIPEILADESKREKFCGILSIEPHLSVFPGLAALENAEKSVVRNKFATRLDAFSAAVSALRGIIE